MRRNMYEIRRPWHACKKEGARRNMYVSKKEHVCKKEGGHDGLINCIIIFRCPVAQKEISNSAQ